MVKRPEGPPFQCPECPETKQTTEEWEAHLKLVHPFEWGQIIEEEKMERRAAASKRARERLRTIQTPEVRRVADLLYIRDAPLNSGLFAAKAWIEKLKEKGHAWDVIDWKSLAESDWQKRYDWDEYKRLITRGVEAEIGTLEGVDEMVERFQEMQKDELQKDLNTLIVEGGDGDAEASLKEFEDLVIQMAKEGDYKAQLYLMNFTKVPHRKFLPVKAPTRRMGKIEKGRIRRLLTELSTGTLRVMVERKQFFGRPMTKAIRQMVAEELELRKIYEGEAEQKPPAPPAAGAPAPPAAPEPERVPRQLESVIRGQFARMTEDIKRHQEESEKTLLGRLRDEVKTLRERAVPRGRRPEGPRIPAGVGMRFTPIAMERSKTATPCPLCKGYFFPWTMVVQNAFQSLNYFPKDKYYFRICGKCKAAGRGPVAQHKQIPTICDFTYEALEKGTVVEHRPYLDVGAFTGVGISEEWIEKCLESKRTLEANLTR